MKRPTNQTALFAQEQFLIYQKLLDEHSFYNQEDRAKMQAEADYWRKQYEDADDSSLIENLGLNTQPNN